MHISYKLISNNMSARPSFSYISWCHMCLIVGSALFHLCLSYPNSHHVLCIDAERQALLGFKHGLIDETQRLASWVVEDRECCRWVGIVCDNSTGHVLRVHLPGLDGHCHFQNYYNTEKEYEEASKQRLRGDISPSLLDLKQLKHLDLSCNDFEGLQILDLAHNNISGNIPQCFNNFSVFSGIGTLSKFQFSFPLGQGSSIADDSLVMKGREDTYSTILGLVRLLDLSSNNLVGHIPSEITSLVGLNSLNLSGNQLSGIIPEKIGEMKELISFDLSFNKLSGELPMSLSKLNFLSSFNVSFNNLTGRIPSSTQIQSFSESSFFGNKLCGAPLNDCVGVEARTQATEELNEDDGGDWGLIISLLVGFVCGFWMTVGPLAVRRSWRMAYFGFLSKLRHMAFDSMH